MFASSCGTAYHVPLSFLSSANSFHPNLTKLKFKIRCSSEPLPTSTIQRIADKLRSLGVIEKTGNQAPAFQNVEAGEVFIPLRQQLPKNRVGHTLDTCLSTPAMPPQEIEKYDEGIIKTKEKRSVPTLAELTLGSGELKRLQRIGIKEKRMLKVGKSGITEGIVNGIHERWKHAEVVKIACEDLSKINMKQTHDILERKTGGMVIWRSGSRIALYRGSNYKYPYFISTGSLESNENPPSSYQKPSVSNQRNLVHGVGSPNKVRIQLSGEAKLVEESDRLLEGLGPRFPDWWGHLPLPVDADLLPAIIPGYRRPFRLLPYGLKPNLTNDEITSLRRLSSHLPFHFVLSRNKQLQGLAASIFKLWEKCEVVKIAIKPSCDANTKIISDELKLLTGGFLLARSDEFIVMYRGKDFLLGSVSSSLDERRKNMIRIKDSTNNRLSNGNGKENVEEGSNGNELRETNKDSTVSQLSKGSGNEEGEAKKEGITEEERYMLRKIGMKMESFLLIGQRGVFSGTIENMHLHWKYRELVKLIFKEKSIDKVHKAAKILEDQSGGILVCVEKISKGYAIIVYRGKSYTRPSCLRPPTLPSKRESLRLSKEVQRRKSWKLDVLKFDKENNKLEDETKLVHDCENSFIESKLVDDCETSNVEAVENNELSKGIREKGIRLSNKDRLLLRKQALSMKKKPVLAIGRSNVVSGLAKAIKLHFEKHPLAIVNIKGRAKGTNVQELILMLEEETDSILVSQEPNKVILYRGWDEQRENRGANAEEPTVSSELIAAIRFECGLDG